MARAQRATLRSARGLRLALAAGAAVGCAGVAGAQLTSLDTGWVHVTNAPAPAPYFLYTRDGTAGDAGNAPAAFNALSPNKFGAVRAGVKGGLSQNGDAVADKAVYSVRYDRTFRLTEAADIKLSAWLTAALKFQGANNTNTAKAIGTMVVYREKTANAGDWEAVGIDSTIELTGNGADTSVTDSLKIGGGRLEAGARRYWVRAEAYGFADSVAGSANGTTAEVNSKDFGARTGLTASMALLPADFNYNSRADVKLDAARRYGLTGKGIKVGIVEPGNVSTGNQLHADLAGRVKIRNGGEAGVFADEHATAVAGIIGGANAALEKSGVAPGASMISSALESFDTWRDVVSDLYAQEGATVINLSAGSPLGQQANTWLSRFRLNQMFSFATHVTFVASAGNEGAPAANGSTVSNQASADNVISVGALNRDGTRRAEFSSYSLSGTMKPDIVAPGEYILSTSPRDADGVAGVNDYRRHFTGGDFETPKGATAGDVSGTSFAAPFVSGAVALMQEYAKMAPATHDARATDSRVLKAVLLNSASKNVKESGGANWRQYTDTVDVNGSQATRVWRSLNAELGAGKLDIDQTLYAYATEEARRADDLLGRNGTIDLATNNGALARDRYWDLQRIEKPDAGADGWATVDYLLGNFAATWDLRATLAWLTQATTVNNQAVEQTPRLELYLFREGTDDGNEPGWEPALPGADELIAFTQQDSGVVRLMDMTGLSVGRYYLQVRSTLILADEFAGIFTSRPEYGLAFTVPSPSGVGVLVLAGLVATRRRRARGG